MSDAAQPFEPTSRIEDLLAAAQSMAAPAEVPGGAPNSAADPAPSAAPAETKLADSALPEDEFTLDDLAKVSEAAQVPEAVVSEFIATTEIALASALNPKTSQGVASATACANAESPETNSGAAPASASASANPSERRRKRRVLISAPVRVRGLDVTREVPDEISTTIDVSRLGLLFITSDARYYCGMEVAVVFPYSSAPTAIHTEQRGHVVRVENTQDGRRAVAISLGAGEGVDLVDAAGRKLASESAAASTSLQPDSKKPIVLAVDADSAIREMTKAALEDEGYSVIAVASCQDAREVLNMFVPALVIAEVEGEGLPGYDLCVHVKATAGLRHVPVVLTTSSAYPSDYSSAHSLGAVVCMAKPYKQDRLCHVARLLAPLPAGNSAPDAAPPRAADPSRKASSMPHFGAGRAPVSTKRYDESTSQRRKLRFPIFR